MTLFSGKGDAFPVKVLNAMPVLAQTTESRNNPSDLSTGQHAASKKPNVKEEVLSQPYLRQCLRSQLLVFTSTLYF